ncbi:alpha/beta hydrolase [Arhodomonas aquaeolei]|uniref:alpha/beta hydrolase n=1 Tax=Arhodomonas aquaeolei TaxID=2369 RepID=UPI00036B0043|nr:alpha/beta hydrolase [Arhodomonas aquaeolei]
MSFLKTMWRAPAIAVLVALAAGCTRLGALDSVMPRDDGARRVARDASYGTRPRQRLDVYAPRAPVAGAPVIVFIYGGSWDSGRRQDYGFVGHALAARGFVTVIPDYRLVPSVRYPAFVEDVAAAVRWTHDHIARYGGDPARIGVAGHSAGAYNAVMLGVAPRYTGADGAEGLPVAAVAGLSGPYDFLPLDVRATRRAFAGVEDLRATQPVAIVGSRGPPLFLATGTADTTVKPRNTTALAERARAQGRRVVVRRYAGADHVDMLLSLGWWFRDDTAALADMIAFFRDTLGGAPEGSDGETATD